MASTPPVVPSGRRAAGGLSYRADIDGLRAVAVGLVVAYHYGIGGFSGGYLGVDLFFVISGFLIASILERSRPLTLRGLLDFYGRRIKRLMPAFVVVALATALGSAALQLPDDWLALLKSIRESLAFRANVHFEHETTGYFASTASELPWLHTWSLSVEWQFYLVFPLLVAALRAAPSRVRRATWPVLVAAGVAGSALMVSRDPTEAYFSSVARAFEFALGAWAASVVRPVPWPTAWPTAAASQTVSLVGVLALVALALHFEPTTPFPGVDAFVVCAIGAALIVAGRDGSILAHRWLAAAGRRSYAIYLWHWPVIAWVRYVQYRPSPLETGLLLTGVALAAEATHRWVERPGTALTWRPLTAFALACVLPFAGTALGYRYVRSHDGFPGRLGPVARHAETNLARFDERQAIRCHRRDADADDCAFGDLDGPASGLLVGDSHARDFRAFLQGLAAEAHLRVVGLTNSECLVLEGAANTSGGADRAACAAAVRRDFAWIRSRHYAYVFLGQRWIGYPPEALAGLDGALATIVASGAKPVLLLSVAEDGTSPKNCFDRPLKLHRSSTDDCAIDRDNDFAREPKRRVDALTDRMRQKYPTLIVVDLQAVQCRGRHCDTVIDATPIYTDTHHLDAFGATMLAGRYRRELGNPLLGR